MNKGRLIGGLICVTIAVLLGTLNIVLPKESMMFIVDGENMPFVPVIVLGILGIVLLATAWRRGADSEKKGEEIVIDPEKAALNKRLETIAWGLFLVMLGGFLLVPMEIVAKGVWSIGVGLIMLGLNAARYFSGLRMSGFTTVLGILSLASGIAELFGMNTFEGAFLLVILGAYLILKPWFDKRQLFGKAEAS